MAQTKRKVKKVAAPKTHRKTGKTHRKTAAARHHRVRRSVRGLSPSMLVALFRANWAPALLGLVAVLIIGIWASNKARHRFKETSPQHSEKSDSPISQMAYGFLAQEFAAATGLTIGEKMQYWSSYLAEYPTKLDEIAKWVEAPTSADIVPWVPKKFDCTTYVEIVASLARSRKIQDFYRELASIRYMNGKPGFFERNHFPEADWIPNNVKAGLLKDVTEKVASASDVDTQVAEKTINKGTWFAAQKQRKEMRGLASALPGSWQEPVNAKVRYVPVESIEKVLSQIPSGAVINLVRESNDRKPVLISHQGIFVREGKQAFFQHSTTAGHRAQVKPYLRHSTVKGEIERVDFVRYLKSQHQKNWPLIGINVIEVLEN